MNHEQLTEYLEQNARIDAIPAEHLAGLWLQENLTVRPYEIEKDIIKVWAEQVDGGQYQYADTIEEFARDLFDGLSEWTEEQEIFNTLAPHVKWRDVYDAELRHDWTSYQLPDKSYLFVIMP